MILSSGLTLRGRRANSVGREDSTHLKEREAELVDVRSQAELVNDEQK